MYGSTGGSGWGCAAGTTGVSPKLRSLCRTELEARAGPASSPLTARAEQGGPARTWGLWAERRPWKPPVWGSDEGRGSLARAGRRRVGAHPSCPHPPDPACPGRTPDAFPVAHSCQTASRPAPGLRLRPGPVSRVRRLRLPETKQAAQGRRQPKVTGGPGSQATRGRGGHLRGLIASDPCADVGNGSR